MHRSFCFLSMTKSIKLDSMSAPLTWESMRVNLRRCSYHSSDHLRIRAAGCAIFTTTDIWLPDPCDRESNVVLFLSIHKLIVVVVYHISRLLWQPEYRQRSIPLQSQPCWQIEYAHRMTSLLAATHWFGTSKGATTSIPIVACRA